MPQPNEWITMVNPDTGATEDVRSDSVSRATEQGWSVETPEQKALREYQKTQGGSFTEAAKAGLESAASTLTFGGYDVAASKLGGEEYRKQRALRDATQKGARIVGEIGGYLVPGLGEVRALGSGAKIARALGAPISAVSRTAGRVGSAVERIAAGEAPGALRTIASKAAGGAAGGALEGAVIGAGQAVSEAALQDKELSAELLLSHVRDGALIGGVLGGGISGGVSALSTAGKAAKGIARHVPYVGELTAGTRGLEGLAETKALTSFGALGSDIRRIVKEGGEEAPHRIGRRILEEGGLTGEGSVGRAFTHDLESASQIASERVAHYNDRLHEVYRKLDAGGERLGVDRIIRDVDEQILGPLRSSGYGGDIRIAKAIERDLAPLTKRIARAEEVASGAKALAEFRAGINEFRALRATDPAAAGNRLVELNGMVGALDDKLSSIGLKPAAGDLERMIGGSGVEASERAFAKLSKNLDELSKREGNPTLSYDDVWKLRHRVDKDIKNWAITSDPRLNAYRDLRELLKGHVSEQASRTGMAQEFADVNAAISDWIKVEKIAKERAGSVAGNRSIGLTDTISGMVGSATGAVLGGGIGAAAGGLAMGTANKFVRSAAGDRLAATLANRFSGMRQVAAAADRAAEKLAGASERAVQARRFRPTGTGLSTRLTADYEDRRASLLDAQSNQARMVAQLQSSLGVVADTAPELAAATARAAGRGLQYALQLAPQAPGYEDLVSRANPETMQPSESEQRDWLSTLGAIEKPSLILEAARKGTITPEQVQAVQLAYPALHRAMAKNILRTAAEASSNGKAPSHQQRLALSMLTGVPLDASARPEVIAAYQSLYSTPVPAPTPSGSLSVASGKATKYAGRRETATNREV